MAQDPPEFWIKVAPGSPLRDAKVIDQSPAQIGAGPVVIEQTYRVGPGAILSIRLGALLARLFGQKQDGYRLDPEGPMPRMCYRIGRRTFIWE